jgi:hypothetical protein
MYLGDFKEDTTNAGALFTSRNTTGEASALTSGLIACYKMSSTIETTAGLTLTSTFDDRVGLNRVQMDLSSTAFYAASEEYGIVLTQGTVNGVSVAGETLFHFSISNRYQGSTHTSTDVFDQSKNAISTLGVTTAASTHTSTDIFDQAKNALSTYGVTTAASTHTSTDVYDQAKNAISTYLSTIADVVWDEALTGATHNVVNSAGRRLRSLQDNGVYALASVWVDEVAGTSVGTVSFEDATVTNRANDFDNAQTVATNVGIRGVQVTSGNSITLTAALEGFDVHGHGSTLALGTQNLGGSHFFMFGNVSGVATTTGGDIMFHDCFLGAVTLPPGSFDHCGIGLGGGTFTVGSAGDFVFYDCFSKVAGSSAPVIDLGAAVGATTMEFRRWSGGLTLNNVAAGDVVSVDVVSGGTITVNGTGGTVVVRGHCTVTDGSGGSVAITQTSVVNMTKIDTSVFDNSKSALSTAGVSTHTSTDIFDQSKNAISTLGVSTHTSTNIFDQAKNALTTMTAAMTESYTTAATPTPAQLLFETNALLAQFAINSTVYTAYQRGSTITAAATWELNDSTSPTALKRTG